VGIDKTRQYRLPSSVNHGIGFFFHIFTDRDDFVSLDRYRPALEYSALLVHRDYVTVFDQNVCQAFT
jgi:hypothetical protein